jgi:uncharacterized protein YajQ (UPF0234 family)
MSSFDIVSSLTWHEVDNAVQSLMREIENRYDFKGVKAEVTYSKEQGITLLASDATKMETMQDLLKVHWTRRSLDARALVFGTLEKASGNAVRCAVTLKEGVDSDTAKQIVKHIKDSKIKVQASIRGEEVRVEGKKRDDLQAVIQLVQGMELALPIQCKNFRD